MLKNLSIKNKIRFSMGLMAITILVVGLVGWYGINLLSTNLKFITGPAWDTADGAMEGTIGIEAQMIAVEKIIAGVKGDTPKTMLEEGKATAEEALSRLISAGLMNQSEIDEFLAAKEIYNTRIENLIKSYQAFAEIKQKFDTNTEAFVDLGEEMEEIGDSAVEEFENNPTQSYNWNDHIKERWQAADGGMEANIGLLWSLYYVSKLVSLTNPDASLSTKINESLSFQQEASDEMLETGRFDGNSGEKWGGKPYSTLYKEYFERHKTLIADLVKAVNTYHIYAIAYDKATDNLLEIIEKFEASGDATVENQVVSLEGVITGIVSLMIFAIIAGLALAAGITFMTHISVIRPLKVIQDRVTNIARGEGDLTARIKEDSNDELGMLAKEFNVFVASIHSIIRNIKEGYDEINHSMTSMQNNTNETANQVKNQKTHTDSIALAFEEMSRTADSIARQTVTMTESANEANKASRSAQSTVSNTIKSIQGLSSEIHSASATISVLEKDVGSIVTVLDVIVGIAEQTNLLALNAAIEAARAGEQGRGFAVVADEVRALASKTQASTAEIQQTISKLKEGSVNAVTAMERSRGQSQVTVEQSEEVSRALNSIVNLVDNINQANLQVASASEEQTAVSQQMTTNVESIVNIAMNAEKSMEQTETSCLTLNSKTQELQNQLRRFKV